MISEYSKLGQYSEALNLASRMHCSNVKLNEMTFSTLLSICANSGCTLFKIVGRESHVG